MVKKDGAETRRIRIEQIARDLQSGFYEKKSKGESEELILSKFVAIQMYKTGLTKSKILDYLSIIETMGQCEIDTDNDKIRKPLV
jgi:hypothetical protein